jgi:hypothetical protein
MINREDLIISNFIMLIVGICFLLIPKELGLKFYGFGVLVASLTNIISISRK